MVGGGMFFWGVYMLRVLVFCFGCGSVYGCGCEDRERVWFVERWDMVSSFAGWSDGGDLV